METSQASHESTSFFSRNKKSDSSKESKEKKQCHKQDIEWQNLESLTLSKIHIEHIDNSLKPIFINFKNLTYLSITHADITYVGDLSYLTNLSVLDLSNNKITVYIS